jgi:radical SAM superfamily enzyme YgiQ (UPF0313 family)
LAEIKKLKLDYNLLNSIRVLDDLFLSNKNKIEAAIRIFDEVQIKWRAMGHIKTFYQLDEAKLEQLKKSGCIELFFGIESGSQHILNMIHKLINPDMTYQTINKVLKAGISVKGYFILGFPEEKTSDMALTYKLASKLTRISNGKGAHFRNSTFQFRPYYGSELYNQIITKNHLPYNALLSKIKFSKEINSHVREKSFNFDSGNFSNVDDKCLFEYIKKMNDLNEKSC